jgi:GT2 family glycosyltransferase
VLSIVIPTYGRGRVLCDTIASLLTLDQAADEIVVVDQTRAHPREIESRLSAWSASGAIRLLKLDTPSIPHAMNAGLRAARNPLVLFLDDDIVPATDLVRAHVAALSDPGLGASAGQVLQPGQVPVPRDDGARGVMDLHFPFHSDSPCEVGNVMAGNLCVRRDTALSIGGFDENFIGVAYRFETDFARRLIASGGRIRFEPAASIRHLRIASGGTRTWGDHRTSLSPMHSVGDYYFALRHVRPFWPYVARRLRSNVLTRFHLRHPWAIAPKIIGEIRGLVLARRLARRLPARAGE